MSANAGGDRQEDSRSDMAGFKAHTTAHGHRDPGESALTLAIDNGDVPQVNALIQTGVSVSEESLRRIGQLLCAEADSPSALLQATSKARLVALTDAVIGSMNPSTSAMAKATHNLWPYTRHGDQFRMALTQSVKAGCAHMVEWLLRHHSEQPLCQDSKSKVLFGERHRTLTQKELTSWLSASEALGHVSTANVLRTFCVEVAGIRQTEAKAE